MKHTTKIVAAFVRNRNHRVGLGDIGDLIGRVKAALTGASEPPLIEPQAPAISVRRSIQPDFIVCLECGKKSKSMKRHLATAHDLTPGAYRSKWRLPHAYPMVAPSYAAVRSELAKKIGLGRPRRGAKPAKAEAAASAAVPALASERASTAKAAPTAQAKATTKAIAKPHPKPSSKGRKKVTPENQG